jgi:ISXO2-like transposase domain
MSRRYQRKRFLPSQAQLSLPLGITLPLVLRSEAQSISTIASRVDGNAIIYADEARHWDILHARFLTKRINHEECYSDADACTNQAESFFSRLRRAEIGTHHRISGRYLSSYASEMAWREENRAAGWPTTPCR